MGRIERFLDDDDKLAELLMALYCENRNLPGGRSLQEWWDEAPEGARLKIDGKVVATKR